MAGDIKITLKRSPIGHPEKHKKVLIGLGLTKLNKAVVRKDTPEVRGMVGKVRHMVAVEEA
jgi:large subunit ribosomal protein L30